jgi:divalent metal cation (Fe/Co/Zn/Cd) transporter
MQPDSEHPLGYGKEIFFWSFIVALILFSMGGLFSIYEGIHKLGSNEGLKSPMIAIVVLSVSIVLEGASLFGCIAQIKKVKQNQSLWNWVKHSRKSELIVILGEDIAALLGLFLALVFIVLAMVSGNPIFDAIGSIGIGILLILVSIFIAIKVKSLLIGQSADAETQTAIHNFILARPEIEQIYNLITLQLGHQIMVAVKVKMGKTDSIPQLISNINICEAELRKAFPEVQWCFFEPDVKA